MIHTAILSSSHTIAQHIWSSGHWRQSIKLLWVGICCILNALLTVCLQNTGAKTLQQKRLFPYSDISNRAQGRKRILLLLCDIQHCKKHSKHKCQLACWLALVLREYCTTTESTANYSIAWAGGELWRSNNIRRLGSPLWTHTELITICFSLTCWVLSSNTRKSRSISASCVSALAACTDGVTLIKGICSTVVM